MTALDTNVVLDLLDGDERFAGSVLRVLDALVHQFLDFRLRQPVRGLDGHRGFGPGEAVWESAGVAFAAYARRRAKHGDEPRRLIADFAIGAHAERAGSLVTRDAAFYRRAFPKLKVVEP